MEEMGIMLELYKTMCLIRKAEKVIQREYHNDEMKTPMHMSAGEEAIVAGVCLALGKNAQFFGTYRSHGLYLAVTGETDKFFAELYGKATGTAGGKAGSMHLASPDDGLIMTSAVVGTTIPVAVGAAFVNKYLDRKTKTAVFFGDGAIDEGVFWESLNLACLWHLPILFVNEDNGFAIHTPTSLRRGYNSVTDIIRHYNCHVANTISTDADFIFNLADNLISLMEQSGQPGFLSCKYYRYLEHVGINEDFEAGYRSKDEFMEWLKRDPLNIQRKKLIGLGYEKTVIQIEQEIDEKISKSIAAAKSAGFLPVETLSNGVFA